MYSGKCLCGAVSFKVTGKIESIIHCHCSLCRKSSGSAFGTNGFVNTQDFKLTSGENNLTQFTFKPGKERYFCKTCGSPIYSAKTEDPDRIRLRIGLIDSDIVERPLSHNFVSSSGNWEDLDADIPCYDGYEPGRYPSTDKR